MPVVWAVARRQPTDPIPRMAAAAPGRTPDTRAAGWWMYGAGGRWDRALVFDPACSVLWAAHVA
jgi:hypothetical protein